MKRSKHTLSHYRMVTANMGDLFPVQCVPVLPGDTMQGSTSALIRVSPLNTPVMHPVTVRTHTFFCPNRIVMDGWEDFITGGNDGQGEGSVLPTGGNNSDKKSLLSYLGVPPISGVNVNYLPMYAVNKIYNEFYRDQDLVPEKALEDNTIEKIAWEKDYFTTARPWSQRGPEVTLPLGTSAEVKTPAGIGTNLAVYSDAEASLQHIDTSGLAALIDTQPGVSNQALYADLANAASPAVNDFRAAFALQRYQEARARYGARFTEYLRYLGINPSDARLQRPELLGGGTTRLNFSEVLQTAPTTGRGGPGGAELGVGDLYGHGIAGMKTGKWRKFFEEHGYVITMMSVRPKALYLNGIPREFLKTTKEDFFQKELANLGQQEIFNNEVSADATTGAETFGYQDRYHEYRSHPSQVSQEFRDNLASFHLARNLPPGTTLNQSFVECNPSRDIFQITDEQYDTLWCMVNNHLVARRMVPKRANPRIL